MRDDVRRRLLALNGKDLAEEPVPDPLATPPEEKRIPLHKRKDRAAKNIEWREWGQTTFPSVKSDAPPELAAILPGAEYVHPLYGTHFCVETQPHEAQGVWRDLGPRFRDAWDRLSHTHKSLKPFRASSPDRILFFDIETTGLSGCPVFLIGVLSLVGEHFVARQYLARRTSEEIGIVAETLEQMHASEVLVSFNGKSFDMPFILNRAAHHRLPFHAEPEHLDLLHQARRHWKSQVPNCRLQTLEQCLFGRERVGDTPSHLIPSVYRRFIESGDARPLKPVMSHNLIDLVTMAELLLLLWESPALPVSSRSASG